MQVLANGNGVPIKGWVDGVVVDDKTWALMRDVASLPFVFKHVALMPDAHLGIGACIGSVIATEGAVVPSIAGVDIGCGMMAVRTTLTEADIPVEKRHELRMTIEEELPAGRINNGGEGDIGAWPASGIPSVVQEAWDMYLAEGYAKTIEKYPKAKAYNDVNHLGTLGTGNHFCEICVDKEGRVWVMLHSGSRGPGNKFGSFFIRLAQDECKKWFVKLPNRDLAYFPASTDLANDYLHAANWAQTFAKLNRDLMMENVLAVLSGVGLGLPSFDIKETVRCHHNYIASEKHFGRKVYVTRKGAIRAQAGDKGIIPGAMGVRSYIVEGLGNRESFCSASHGAGRTMSRTQARKTFTVEDHKAATEGLEWLKDESVLDETPVAYKDIDVVMAAQTDLVKPIHTLRAIICIKGADVRGRRK